MSGLAGSGIAVEAPGFLPVAASNAAIEPRMPCPPRKVDDDFVFDDERAPAWKE
jgi:hypothetical protein